MRPAVLALLAVAACAGARTPAAISQRQEVVANDNRSPAGRLENGVLALRLEIAAAPWRWERRLPPYRVLAFAEAGGPLMTPGPLIRVREGTIVDLTVENRVGLDVDLHGLHQRPGERPALRLRAGGRLHVRFLAGVPGTYYYWGAVRGGTFDQREGADSQLGGALIIDPAAGSPPDRVFVIGHHASTAGPMLDAWVINGRSWPDTERFTLDVGKPVRWRWINATSHRHPMHLHGTYFRVEHAGDNRHDDSLRPPPLVVTQVMQPGATMTMRWAPARPGNWLFHCHILFHVIPDGRLPLPRWYQDYADLPHDQHMAGLVLGIHARGPRQAAPSRGPPRRLALVVGERAGVHFEIPGLSSPGLGYGLDGGPITAPGPMLVLERGKPVEVAITNRIAHATTVHWHGIELESYYDGVPHWGTDGRNTTPFIRPGETFVARFTPPRAGTFIYHTHFNDFAQLASGLYGPLIVIEPGAELDPAVDHTIVVSRDGLDDEGAPVLINGAARPADIHLRARRRHRLRLIGITPNASVRVRLLDRGAPVTWRRTAKDGATLTAPGALEPADLTISPGETYDLEVIPDRPGELELEAVLDGGQGQRAAARLLVEP